jgi:hypothetical protein
VRSRLAAAKAARLGTLVACATMQEMRSTGSRAPFALVNSTLPRQQELDAVQHCFKIGTLGPAIGCRQAI